MSSTDGKRRPRPVASTFSPNTGQRIAKRASESAGLGEATAHVDTVDVFRKSREGRGRLAKNQEPPKELVELPNESSSLGLSRPQLVPYEPEVIDAKNRGAIATRLLNLLALILIILSGAIVAATFTGTPTSALITYTKWVASALVPLFTMALGYYFGTAQRSQQHKR